MAHKNKHLCPCGSGKRTKLCCRGALHATNTSLTSSTKFEMRVRAEALAAAGKHLEACEILEQLVAASPLNPLIWNDLGVQYQASGQTDKAFNALKRGYQCDSTYPPVLYNLGRFTLDHFLSLRKAGEVSSAEAHRLLDKAIMFLKANLDIDPENVDAHYSLASAYGINQDKERADAHMTVALRIRDEQEAFQNVELLSAKGDSEN